MKILKDYSMVLICLFFLLVINPAHSQEQDLPISVSLDSLAEAESDTALFVIDSTILEQIRLNPRDAQFHLHRAHEYFERGELDSAEIYYKISLALCDTLPEVYNRLGVIESQKKPHKIIPVEKMLGLLKRDHQSKAIKLFKKALKLSPDFLDARYNLGKTYLKKGGDNDLENAEKELQNVLDRVLRYKDTVYYLGRVYQEQKKYSAAIQIFRELSQSRQADGRESIQLSKIYYEIDQLELACRSFYQGIEILTNQELLEELYESIELLLTKEEKTEYSQLDISRKGMFFKKFWKERDPSPGTPLNERLIEHFRRVSFALATFSKTVPPYYDDRGKIYIRYGEPDERYSSPIDNTLAKQSESWSYERIQEGLVFDFVEDGGIYHLAQDLRDAALAGTDYSTRLLLAAQLYQDRAHLSPTYARLAATIDETRLSQYQMDRIDAIEKASPEFFVADEEAKPLPLVSKWSQFKGHADSTDIVFYFSLPAKLFNFSNTMGSDRFRSNIRYTMVTLDPDFDEVFQYRLSSSIYLPSLQNVEFGNFVFQNQFSATEGDYQVQLLVETDNPKRTGLYKNECPIRNFKSDRLMLSDVLIASEVGPVESDTTRQFIRNGLRIIPHPFYSVLKKRPLYIYYEIYNLNYDSDGMANYEVQYTVKTIKADKSLASKAFGWIGSLVGGKEERSLSISQKHTADQMNIFEYIGFDLENLEPGINRLKVTVTDFNINTTLSDSVEFKLLE